MIRQTTAEEIREQGFQPEPHTTWFGYDGDWWCYDLGGKPVSCLVVRTVGKQKRKVIAGVFTEQKFRGRGIMHLLLSYVVNDVYAGVPLFAGCLISSKRIFEDCGFAHYKTVPYKHGTQYFMRRDAFVWRESHAKKS